MIRSEAEGGFSLIEIMMVVAIMGIIVTIAVATYVVSVSHARRISCEANQRILTDAASVYSADHKGPPSTIEDLRPYASTFDTVITCPSDSTVMLEWNATLEEVVCPIHP